MTMTTTAAHLRQRRAVVRLTEEELAVRLALPAGTRVDTIRHRYESDTYDLLVTSEELDEVAPGADAPVVGADLLAPVPVRERHVMRLGDLLAGDVDGVDTAYVREALIELLDVDADQLAGYLLIRS